jgi:hypothetical protein
MAIQKKKPLGSERRTSSAPAVRAPEKWPFGRTNYILFGVALVVIVLGFLMLSQGSIDLAPVLLVLGYCVLVPWAILAKDKGPAVVATDSSTAEPKTP